MIHLYTFYVQGHNFILSNGIINMQANITITCAMKAPSWPQMTLNVFWLKKLEVRGRMLEYEDAMGGNAFQFAVLLVYS